jgi:hypothetical protein
LQKLIESLKLREARGIDGISNECLRQLPRRPLVHLTNCLTTAFGFLIFSSHGKKQKL